MRRIVKTDGGSKSKERDERVKAATEISPLDSRIELIQMLIPLGLKAWPKRSKTLRSAAGVSSSAVRNSKSRFEQSTGVKYWA